MFLEVAIGAIAIGIILMVGYVVISMVQSAMPTTSTITVRNPCQNLVGTAQCTAQTDCVGAITDNSSQYIRCQDAHLATGLSSSKTTVYAGFGLLAVGVVVLAAYGLIAVFK